MHTVTRAPPLADFAVVKANQWKSSTGYDVLNSLLISHSSIEDQFTFY